MAKKGATKAASADKPGRFAFPPCRLWIIRRGGKASLFGPWRPAWEEQALRRTADDYAAAHQDTIAGVLVQTWHRGICSATHDGEQWFRFEMALFGVPMDRIDQFLASDPRLRQDEREELLIERAEALHAYRSGNFEVALKTAQGLYKSYQHWAVVVAALPHVKKARDFNGQAGADANRELANFEHEELDREIQASIARRENPRLHVKKWIEEYKVSQPTVYRRIEKGEGKKS